VLVLFGLMNIGMASDEFRWMAVIVNALFVGWAWRRALVARRERRRLTLRDCNDTR
jgi:hypothetical protein